MDSKKAEPGSVSHGTMRPQDLIPKFFEELDELDTAKCAEIVGEEPLLPICHPKHIDWDEWVKHHPEAADYLLEDLFDALGECAPDGHYFGASAGDGCDYGFWPFEVEDACLLVEEQAKTGR
jgi:hypothetical protein